MAEAQSRAKLGRKKIEKAFRRYPPSRRTQIVADAATARLAPEGYQPMCNFFVRLLATQVLVNAILRHFSQVRQDTSVRHYFLTASFDTGITFEDAPEVDVAAMIRKVRDMLASLNLSAACVLEIDVLSKKLPGDRSRLLLFQVHGICWTRDRAFKPKRFGRLQSARRCFSHRLGFPAIKFVSRRESASRHKRPDDQPDLRFAKLDRDQIARSMASMAGYMLKHPLKAKHRFTDPEGDVHVYDDERAFRLKTALRLAELWSHITPQQAVFAVGREGQQVGKRFRDELRRHSRQRGGPKSPYLDRQELERDWRRFFIEHAKLGFSPSRLKQRDYR